jgi:hypothetical protein
MTKTYDFYKDNMLEAIYLLREAKKAGKELKLKVKLFDSTVVIDSTQSEEEWLKSFQFSSMNEFTKSRFDRLYYGSHIKLGEKAQYLEHLFGECKYDIYPQRAQQFVEFLGSLPEFEAYYDLEKSVSSNVYKGFRYSTPVVECFKLISERNAANPEKGFKEILMHIKNDENNAKVYKKKSPRSYDRETIFSAFILFYPGGYELVKKYAPEFVEANAEKLATVVAENERFDRELIEKSIDPVLENSPVQIAKDKIKKSTAEELEVQRKYGFDNLIRLDTSVFEFSEIYDLLKNAQENGVALTVNNASSTEPESTWFTQILGDSQESYEKAAARKTEQEKINAEIKAKYIDGMRDHIYPQRFQLWKKFVEICTQFNEWGEPAVYLDPIIPALAEYIPMVNNDSKRLDKKVIHEIKKLDGPINPALIVNIMLFAKRGPEFVKLNDELMYQIREQECLKIAAENAAFKEEIQKVRTF